MKNNLLKLAGSLLAALALGTAAKASLINGDAYISAGAVASIDFTNNTVSFTPSSSNAFLYAGTGDYASFAPSVVTMSDFDYDLPTGPTTIWSFASGSFTLYGLTSQSETSNPGLVLNGWGVATLLGKDPTFGLWSFSANTTNGVKFSFSSTTTATGRNVPDNGMTALLLGLGLLSAGIASRRLSLKV